MALRVLVIGGSVGGLFAANLLQAAGHEAAVFERTAGDLGDRGTGIGTREDLFAVMRRVGIAVDASIGVVVRGRVGLDHRGRVLHECATPSVTSAWSRIWRPLRQALPAGAHHGGLALTGLEQDADGVIATFADGSSRRGDVLVAADGLHSTIRRLLMPAVEPRYAGYVAWRGVIDEPTVDLERRDLLFEHMVFGFADGELMLSIPMPGPGDGPHRGSRRCHFVWFRPVEEAALADLCTDASGRRHGLSIPPPLIRPELIRDLRADAAARLAPQIADLVERTAQIILQPIFDLESPRIALGRIALLGDAAFVARPHVATGVTKAALDAVALAGALAASPDDVETALARYEAERLPYGRWLVERGRRIAQHVLADGGDPQRRVETLMTEYGAAGLVDRQPITATLPG